MHSMPEPPPIRTPRLVLKVASAAQLRASLSEPSSFAPTVGCAVAPDWPPKYWEQGPVDWLVARMTEQPDEVFWRGWFIYRCQDAASDLLVGTAGFKGPPGGSGSETDGVVEVGYGVVTSHWRRGIASEAVGGLLAWAAGDPRVRAFRAHTLAGDPASGGVLLKNGFVRTATISDPEDGEIDRYERSLGGRRAETSRSGVE